MARQSKSRIANRVSQKNKQQTEQLSYPTMPPVNAQTIVSGGGGVEVPEIDRAALFQQLGTTGLLRYGGNIYEEFLRELQLRRGVNLYREMRDNHPVISAVFFAIEMALRQVRWHVEPPSDDPADAELADFFDGCMDDMSFTWHDTITQVCTMLQYGWSFFELIYKVRKGRDVKPDSNYNDGQFGWMQWVPLGQDTLAPGQGWIFDENGGVQGIRQLAPPDWKLRVLPSEKMLLFRTTVAKNNPEGRSILRGMYMPYYYGKNMMEIEGIAAERMGTGVPVVYLGKGTTKSGTNSDLALAQKITRDVRVDEQMGVVIPHPKMTADGEGMLFELVSPPSRGVIDFNQTINRYDTRIAMAVLAQFIMLGVERVGSYALSKSHSDLFILALSAWADSIAEVVNRFAIPRLAKLNAFDAEELPKLAHSEVEVPDLAEIGDYVNKLVGANVLHADDTLEQVLREKAKLPERPIQVTEESVSGVDDRQAGDGGLGNQETPNENTGTSGNEVTPQDAAKQAEQIKQGQARAKNKSERFADIRSARGGARYESATNDYQKQLERIYTDWYTDLAKRLEKADTDQHRDELLITALNDLEKQLKDAGRDGLLEAIQLGTGDKSLSPDGYSALADQVTQNDAFIENSLIPAIRDKMREAMRDPTMLLAGAVALQGVLQTFVGRVASYAGAFWQTIFHGVGDAVKQETNYADLRVEVMLDPAAEHCEDCPELAGVYANWDDMLAQSGIPSTLGRSRCGANCRCVLRVETYPNSGVFERM